jgi:hypothetical protein
VAAIDAIDLSNGPEFLQGTEVFPLHPQAKLAPIEATTVGESITSQPLIISSCIRFVVHAGSAALKVGLARRSDLTSKKDDRVGDELGATGTLARGARRTTPIQKSKVKFSTETK